jgi:hypothetical protein
MLIIIGRIPRSVTWRLQPMPEIKRLRKHLFVDPKVQSALIVRVVLYWVLCLIGIALMLLCWQIITGPVRLFSRHFDDMWFYYKPVLIASFVLLPLVIVDILRFSNRFVGPLLRLRRSMRELARGENVEPIEFRDTDFWQEIADEFNAVRARMQAPASPPQIEREEEKEPASVG